MDELIVGIIAIAYLAWAIYAGNRILTGKSQWLDGDGDRGAADVDVRGEKKSC